MAASARSSTRLPVATALRGWRVWGLPRDVLAGVLAVDVTALAAVVLLVPRERVGARDLVLAVALTVAAMSHVELARRIERRRELDAVDRPYIDLKSMWSFAALLLLPLGPALAVVSVPWLFWWWRMPHRPLPHRWLFSWSAVVLASVAAAAVVRGLDGPAPFLLDGPRALLVVVLAVLVRWAVNHGLTSAVVTRTARTAGSWPLAWGRRFLAPTDTAVGLTALSLGVLLAVLVAVTPWAVPALVLPTLLVHRGLMLQHVERATHLDAKTGLATAARWHRGAERVVTPGRSRRAGGGILMVDLDEFKQVNDRWGHLAGDRVLRAVAEVLAAEVPGPDAVGRFGGEEFVVLLRDVPPARVAEVAEQLRRCVSAISLVCPVSTADTAGTVIDGISVSIGVATFPGSGSTLDELLLAADTALYEAKRAGRNRVCTAPG